MVEGGAEGKVGGGALVVHSATGSALASGSAVPPRTGPPGDGQARAARWVAAALLAIHAALLAWSDSRHSPAVDELGHLPAGIAHWQFGRFDLYRVNPPLVRVLAALPVFLLGPATDWRDLHTYARPEWSIGARFVTANGTASFWYFTLARWACIPLSLIGGWICFRWASDLYGASAGLLALALWCFSPDVLADAAMITPDAGAAALGVAGHYLFWKWLIDPCWRRALPAGLILGALELTKFTWIVLFGLWPVLGLITATSEARGRPHGATRRQTVQLAVMMLLALYVVNVGYGFEGSFRRLGDYPFESRALTVGTGNGDTRENRFGRSGLARLPVPLPENYLIGIDRQKVDFERTMWSFLRGEHRRGGWWYYYLYALAIKVPLGTWTLAVLALLLTWRSRGFRARWRDEVVLLSPAAVVLVLVSSQTGFNHHIRYVLPVYPFAFIWIGKVGRCVEVRRRGVAAAAGAALLWSITSSLTVYPHSLSYFNEMVGGPTQGHYHLIDSNIDWGQDLLYLKDWCVTHPEARPMFVDCHSMVRPRECGIPASPVPAVLVPGWYAISVHQLHGRDGSREFFLRRRPVAMAGYSIYLYRVTAEDFARQPRAGK